MMEGRRPAERMVLSADELRLVRLFRCLSLDSQDELLTELARDLLSTTPINGPYGRPDEREAYEQEELASDLNERLEQAMPPMEPWGYLDDWMSQTLAAAFDIDAGDLVSALLGSSNRNPDSAKQLLEAVEETASVEQFVEPPWFDEENMLEFITAWRERILKALEARRVDKSPDRDPAND